MSTGDSCKLPHKKTVKVADMEFAVQFGMVNNTPIAIAVYGLPEVTVTDITGLSLEHAVFNAEKFLRHLYFLADDLQSVAPNISP